MRLLVADIAVPMLLEVLEALRFAGLFPRNSISIGIRLFEFEKFEMHDSYTYIRAPVLLPCPYSPMIAICLPAGFLDHDERYSPKSDDRVSVPVGSDDILDGVYMSFITLSLSGNVLASTLRMMSLK